MTGEMDLEKLKAYAKLVFGALGGAMTATMIHLGDRLGLYRALADGEALTSAELAARTGCAERWVREWLCQQGAARGCGAGRGPGARRPGCGRRLRRRGCGPRDGEGLSALGVPRLGRLRARTRARRGEPPGRRRAERHVPRRAPRAAARRCPLRA